MVLRGVNKSVLRTKWTMYSRQYSHMKRPLDEIRLHTLVLSFAACLWMAGCLSGASAFSGTVESCTSSRIQTLIDLSSNQLTQAHLTLKNAQNGGVNEVGEPEVFRTFELMVSAHALAYYDLNKAKEIFNIILDQQTDSGMIPHLWYSAEPNEPDKTLWGLNKADTTNFRSNLPTHPFLALSIMHWFDESIDQAGGVEGPDNDEERTIGVTAMDFLESNFDKVFSFYKWWFNNRGIETGKGTLLVNHHPWETLMPSTVVWGHLFEETNSTASCVTGEQVSAFAKAYPVEFANATRLALDQCLAECYSVTEELTTAAAREMNCSLALAAVTTNAEAYMSLKQLHRMGSIVGTSSSKLQQIRDWEDAVLEGSMKSLLSSSSNFGFDAQVRFGDEVSELIPREEYLSVNAAILSLGELNTTDARFQSGVRKWKSNALITLLSDRFLPGPSFCSLDRLSAEFNTTYSMNGPVWLRSNALLIYALEQLGAPGLVSALRVHSQNLLCQQSQDAGNGGFTIWEAYDSTTGKALTGSDSSLASASAIFMFHKIPKMAIPDNRSVNIVGVGVAVAINVLVVLGMASGCVVIGLKVLRNMSQTAARQGGRENTLGFAVPTLHEFDDQATTDKQSAEKPGGDEVDASGPLQETKAAYTVQPTINTQNEEDSSDRVGPEHQEQGKGKNSWLPQWVFG